jgi:hypothetical protein
MRRSTVRSPPGQLLFPGQNNKLFNAKLTNVAGGVLYLNFIIFMSKIYNLTAFWNCH